LLKDIWCLAQINCPMGGNARYWKTLDIGYEIMGQLTCIYFKTCKTSKIVQCGLM
jgi:hypothetical protein